MYSAKKLHRILSSGEIRKTFIDYFILNHDHKFVRSSPVVPLWDPTVAFVNAGMNQFKSVFLGRTQPPYPRVANSQKCVRVGGKHNDLSVVGQDGYHHTFFEMLGNWSFGDYFKREACTMALELLRGPYNIDPNRLYVTFFAGDKVLGLPADLECLDIWRTLGFPAERILPFGAVDNFWEMGTSGPCGPCTEIHIDHRPDLANTSERAKVVNSGSPDLTELWNLVFIQYNRNEDGTISKLPSHHVDTGMGFERLTAILQNKPSNYDTDLFTPIFDGIQKVSKAPAYSGSFPTIGDAATLDTGYRILADHARMVTACLADGMLPDQNQKLRRVLRKAFMVSENVFASETLLSQVVPIVVESLGAAYPEMYTKQDAILELIAHEQDVFKSLRASSQRAFAEALVEFPNLDEIDLMESPGFVPAYREYQVQKKQFEKNTIPGKFLFKLTDTYGLNEDEFRKLAELENMECDMRGYKEELLNAKLKTRQMHCQPKDADGNDPVLLKDLLGPLTELTQQLPATDNRHKYDYKYDLEARSYLLPRLSARVTGTLRSDVSGSSNDGLFFVVTDRSNFYYESGGQQSDRGKLRFRADGGADEVVELEVMNVMHLNGCVIHVCHCPSTVGDLELAVGTEVELEVDAVHRKMNICHHTATHLLNGAIRCLFNKVTYQVSSAVTSDCCKLEVGLIGKRIGKEDVESIEDLIGRVICSATPIEVDEIDASEVLKQTDITTVPGEVYPERGLRLVRVNCDQLQLASKELCCGTHVTNTQEIEYFCITNLKQTNRARYAFTAVAGPAAKDVLKAAALIRHRVDLLEQEFKTDKLTNATEIELQKIRNSLIHSGMVLPYTFKVDTLQRINDILKKLKETTRTTLKEFLEVEMKNVLQEKPEATYPFILHYICSSALMEEVPLPKATKLCPDRPILVVSMCDGVVKARCCVPKKFITDQFSAEKWLKVFAGEFKGHVAAPKGQDPSEVCNMKGKRVSTQFEEQLEVAMADASQFATNHVH